MTEDKPHPGPGAPPFWDHPDKLQSKIDQYFIHIQGEYHEEEKNVDGELQKVKVWDRLPDPPTITGLCLFLGFESRQSFYDYGKKLQFSYTIKKARLRIENEYEKMLHSKYPTGPIFALKNLGWADKQEVDHTTGGEKLPATKHEVIFKDYSKNDKP